MVARVRGVPSKRKGFVLRSTAYLSVGCPPHRLVSNVLNASPMTDRASLPPVSPGNVLAGKYRVERVIGAGGMGVVVQATHLELDERVAMKFLLPHAIENAEAATRFVREARAAVKIKSEHVARVTDVGRLENGAPYIVMEYPAGLRSRRGASERPALHRGRRGLRAPGLRRHGRGARGQHRPPRSQAVEPFHVDCVPTERRSSRCSISAFRRSMSPTRATPG